MFEPLKRLKTAMRYWLFPESRRIDERTEQFDQDFAEIKRQKDKVAEVINRANQADVLRNLVINMSNDRRTS